MKRKSLLGVFVLLVVFAGFAVSAMAQEPLNWKRGYIGPMVGYAKGDTYWYEKSNPDNLADHEPAGGMLGLQGGYNFQFGNFILGIEGDLALANLEDESPSTVYAGYTKHTKVNMLATLAARMGYSFGKVMAYLKAGSAFSGDEYTIKYNGAEWASENELRVGWTIGGGAEFMFSDHWSMKLEYGYLDMGNEDITFSPWLSPPELWDIEQKFSVIKFGVNYLF